MSRMFNRAGNDALPPVITALLIANGLVYLAQMAMPGVLTQYFALWPVGTPNVVATPYGMEHVPGFAPWQVISYAFLHGSLLHIGLNMFALWMFGVAIENAWGSRLFAIYYFVCVIGAALVQLGVVSWSAHTGGGIFPTIGASGGVFGILLAFGMMFPNQIIMLLFPPIPMKAKWFVVIFGGLELWFGMTGTEAGVAHFAHLGGMAFGFLLIQYWRGKLPVKPRRRMLW